MSVYETLSTVSIVNGFIKLCRISIHIKLRRISVHIKLCRISIVLWSKSEAGLLFLVLHTYREVDYTIGIFQSIGFKEFHEYLLLTEEDRQSNSGKETFQLCKYNTFNM